ncbi:hypothetical protein T02_15107 [Trichinella nativa]|uniref:Uncharacterized protein n=1 Tax=Trichinella nativa TaxID=6335 RepID=A0A0V1L0Z1_9BILA|nr:hypothetical protein T02_15107 [Trichinella nativa]
MADLKKRSSEETNPISAVYDKEVYAASAEPSTSAGYFPVLKRVNSMMYSHRSKRYPKLPEHRRTWKFLTHLGQQRNPSDAMQQSPPKPDKLKQWVFVRSKPDSFQSEARSRIRYTLAQPEFNAEQTMTKSSQQHLIYHPPTNYILNFATKTLEDRLAWNVKKRITFTIRRINEKVEMLMALAFLVVQLVSAGFEILNVGASGQIETLFEYLQQEWLMNVKTS